jgi:integrase
MSVRKRIWNSNGVEKEAWIVDYVDQHGDRHIRTFRLKKLADAYHAQVATEARAGIHTAPSKSISVEDMARVWLKGCDGNIERSTLATYGQHVELHIVPLLGSFTLAQLTTPLIRDFEDRLRQQGRSKEMIRKVLVRLGSILADAQERGLVAQNVVRNLKANRRRGSQRQAQQRANGKLKVGVDIPTPDEIRALIAQVDERWRALILTAVFTGLRASELRGLRWVDIDLKKSEIHVRQRADRFNEIGQPKSAAGERVIPIPPILVNTLQERQLASRHGLVFANGRGNVENWANIVNRGFYPAQIAAGLIGSDGKPKYGLHALRHFFASWCINRKVDGGLELPLKLVQARLGHATITMTADTYGHLFPRGDDGGELAAAELALLG